MDVLVFDIETIPDLALAKRLYDWPSMSDQEAQSALDAKLLAEKGSTFAPLHLHKIVAISLVMRRGPDLRCWSLGDLESSEADLISRFYKGLERFSPRLISWNGAGFDLPVLHYRALKNKVQAAHYWETGEQRADFRYNNYLNRYHQRHTDLMDVLALYQGRGNARLDQVALMLGYPGKMGMDGSKVAEAVAGGHLHKVRQYCETDVLNTYLVYLRFQLMTGQLTTAQLEIEEDKVKAFLDEQGQVGGQRHFQEFLEQWLHAA